MDALTALEETIHRALKGRLPPYLMRACTVDCLMAIQEQHGGRSLYIPKSSTPRELTAAAIRGMHAEGLPTHVIAHRTGAAPDLVRRVIRGR